MVPLAGSGTCANKTCFVGHRGWIGHVELALVSYTEHRLDSETPNAWLHGVGDELRARDVQLGKLYLI